MGQVFLATDLWRGERVVALKQAQSSDRASRASLEREFRWLCRLRHPNVVAVHDFGQCLDSGSFFYTMDRVEGPSLETAAAELPFDRRASLVVQLCRALEFVHSRGLVHGDVKADNVLVRDLADDEAALGTPEVTLVDFGLARAVGEERPGPRGKFSGTLSHAAPELLGGEGELGTSSDLYALGITLFRLFAGRSPFDKDDPVALAEAHRKQAPPPVAELAPSLPGPVATAIDRLLAKDPRDRPTTALVVAEPLAEAVEGLELETTESLLAHARPPHLVGQDTVRDQLHELLERAVDRRAEGPRAFLLVGSAGTGKTRLMEEVRQGAQVQGMRVLGGRGVGGREPFARPLRDAVRHLGRDAIVVRENLPKLAAVDAELVRELGLTPLPPLPGADEQLRAATAFWEILAATADRPVLLQLDDAQHLYEEDAWLLSFLVRSLDLAPARGRRLPLAIVVASRPDGEAVEKYARAFDRGGLQARLRTLSETDTETLVGSMLPRLRGRREVSATLHRSTGGNAHLAEGWVGALIRAGALTRQAREWVAELDHEAFQRAPRGSVDALAGAIEALPRVLQRPLTALALLPDELPTSDVASLLQRDSEELERQLDRLELSDLVVAPARPEGRVVSPASALVRQACLEAAGEEAFHRLALSLLDRSEVVGALGPEARAELAERGGRIEAAAGYWEQALQGAQELRDAQRAAAHAERLASCSQGSLRRFALRSRAEALLQLDRAEDAEASVAAAVATAGQAARAERAELARVEVAIFQRRGLHARAAERAGDLISLTEKGSVEHWRAELELARSLSSQGNAIAPDMLRRLERTAPDLTCRRDALFNLSGDALRRTRYKAAIDALRATRELLQQGEDPIMEASCENNLGVAHLRLGRLDESATHLSRAVELRKQLGARAAMSTSLTNLALLETTRGAPSVAARQLTAALAIKEEAGELQGVVVCRSGLTSAALDRDDFLELARQEAACRKVLEEIGHEFADHTLRMNSAEAKLLMGDIEAVRTELEVLEGLAEDAAFGYRTQLELLLAQLSLAEGRHAEAIQRLQDLATNVEEGNGATLQDGAAHLAEALVGGRMTFCLQERVPVPDDRINDAHGWCERAHSLADELASPQAMMRAVLVQAAVHAEQSRSAPRSLRRVQAELEAAAELAPRVQKKSLQVELATAQAWLLARKGRLREAEAEYERALRLVRGWLRRVPAESRDVFLADPRRAHLRQALIEVRQARLRATSDGGYFAVLTSEPVQRRSSPELGKLTRELTSARAEQGRLRKVIEITREINALVPVRELLEHVLDSAMEFMDAERGFIVLSSREGDLDFASSRDRQGRAVPHAEFAVSRSVLNEVIRTKLPVLSSDARTDRRFVSKESVFLLDLRSVLVAPLVAHEEVIGALYVDNPQQKGAFDERDRDLLSLFAGQAAVAVENARLHRLRIDKDLLDKELAIAREIQQGMLPRQLPSIPGFAVAASMSPAREIGGDYYDCIEMHGDHCRLAVGDVSGKGVPAGLVMVMAHSILRAVGVRDEGLDRVLSQANDMLESRIEDDTFMTMLLLELSPDGTVHSCLAGHEPPMIYRRGSDTVEQLEPGGLALGVFRDIEDRLSEKRIETEPGDLILCYSDGVTDCRSPKGELFGRDRLKDLVRTGAGGGASGLLEHLHSELEDFRAGAERSDDVTLVIIEATGRDQADAQEDKTGDPS